MASPDGPGHAARLALGHARLAIIIAVAANGTIGADGALPWRLPADLRRFRLLTSGHAIIMGRRTWESIGRPLPDRQSIVVTRSTSFRAPGAEVAHSLDQALTLVRRPLPAFCIGGAQLYADALPASDVLYVTEIARDVPGDTRLPPIDARTWREVEREPHPPDGPDALPFAFVTYVRRTGPAPA